MSARRRDSFANLVTGVFMLAVLAMLVYFTVVISGIDLLTGRERRHAAIVFQEVGGLKDHDAVMYRGTKVGIIDRIELMEKGLRVHVEIDPSVIVRKTYRASVGNLSMLGGNFLLLEEGEGDVLDLATTELRGETPTNWMRDLSDVAKNLRRITSSEEVDQIIKNIQEITASTEEIMARVRRGEGTVGRLLSADDTLYTEATGTVAVIKKTFAHASEVSEELEKADIVKDLKEAIAAFKVAAESYNLGDQTKEEMKFVVTETKKLMEALNKFADRLSADDSTIGRLVNDDKLFKEVDGAIRDCRQVLDNYRDTTPITTFSSLATGAL